MKEKKKQALKRRKVQAKRAAVRAILARRSEEERIEAKERAEEMRIKRRKGELKDMQSNREFLPGRNDPCLCGSNKKFKKCCLNRIKSGEVQVVSEYDPSLGLNKPQAMTERRPTTENTATEKQNREEQNEPTT